MKCSNVQLYIPYSERNTWDLSFKKHAASPDFNFVICQNSFQRHTYETDYHGLIKFSTWSDELLIDYYRLL